jgi:hypothetical protein
VQDTLFLPHMVKQVSDVGGLASNHDHFGANVFVQVHVGGGQNLGRVVVLNLDQLFTQAALVMVVKK